MPHLTTLFASPTTIPLTIFLVAVAAIDTRRHRIPNALTVPAAALGLALRYAESGGPGVLHGLAGLFAGLALFFPFFLARAFGAGDVKALGAIGAFLGPQATLFAAAWILIAGAAGGLLVLARTGGLPALRALLARWSMRSAMAMADLAPIAIAPAAGDPARRRFPYGIAIACGTLLSLTWS